MPANPFLAGLVEGIRVKQQQEAQARSLLPLQLKLEQQARSREALGAFLESMQSGRTPKGMGSAEELVNMPSGQGGGRDVGATPIPETSSISAADRLGSLVPPGPSYQDVNAALIRGIATSPESASTLATLAGLQPGYQKGLVAQKLGVKESELALGAKYRERKPINLGQGQYLTYDDETGAWDIEGEAKPKSKTVEQLIGEDLGPNASPGDILKALEEREVRIKKKTEKPEKPEKTPSQAMARISQIDKLLATMDRGDTITQMLVAANPALSNALGQKLDPQLKEDWTEQLKTERDYLKQFVPKKAEKPQAPRLNLGAESRRKERAESSTVEAALPAGLSEADIDFNMKKYGKTREEVITKYKEGQSAGQTWP